MNKYLSEFTIILGGFYFLPKGFFFPPDIQNMNTTEILVQ